VGSEGKNSGLLLPLQTGQDFLYHCVVGIAEAETLGALSPFPEAES
jgi:hypothetical protein